MGAMAARLARAIKPLRRHLHPSYQNSRTTPSGNELPPVVHDEVSVQGYDRLIIVGDPHGCSEELAELVDRRVQARQGKDKVILTGDVVNKGPDSIGALRLARRRGWESVRGNHDDAALAALRRAPKERGPFSWVERMSREDVEWLCALPFSIAVPELDLAVVHAGCLPDRPVHEQSLVHLLKMRDVVPGSSPQGLEETGAVEGARPWAKEWPGNPFLVFGHDARRMLQKEQGALGLDTGCIYGGSLTAVEIDVADGLPGDVESFRLVSVEPPGQYVAPGS